MAILLLSLPPQGDPTSSYLLSKRVLELQDPFHFDVLPTHLAALVLLNNRSLLAYIAHQLLHCYPYHCIAWFAGGCYYYVIRKFDLARKFLLKSTLLNHNFAPAWILYGHVFGDESDQALAAYRTASRLFPGSQLPWLFLGMEYSRTNHALLGQQCLQLGLSVAPQDPFLYNELGVLAHRQGQFRHAVNLFSRANELLGGSGRSGETDRGEQVLAGDEGFWQNLAHAYLKLNE